MKSGFVSALLIVLWAVLPACAKEMRVTVVYDDRPTEIALARAEAGQLWIEASDLKRATRFEVKPQGVCREELCFPLPKARRQEFLHQEAAASWFNLTAFAALVRQPVAYDEALAMWYFGLRSDQRQGLSSLEATDFTLPDINGKAHSLSDFRGKKVLLLTWASW